MRDIKVVIGANFGDEGKGLMTDYYVRKSKGSAIVVRHNSGAQAGHTVVDASGKRYTFHHFGSGTAAGAKTYLSQFFVTNPLLFYDEYNKLCAAGIAPKILMDDKCKISTPYDMMLNQIIESYRGEDRHGSCGIGFNETIERCLKAPETKITVGEARDHEFSKINHKLLMIRNNYVYRRLAELGITKIPENYLSYFNSPVIHKKFMDDMMYMVNRAHQHTTAEILKQHDTIIFEGAQGLMLDEKYKFFPHVTRSHPGIQNVAKMLRALGLNNENIEITYVTRCYMTRHGAGPFPTELPEMPYQNIVDKTNIPNPHQGALRFGLLDVTDLARNIKADLRHARGLNYKASVAVTCLDHTTNWQMKYMYKGKYKEAYWDVMVGDILKAVGTDYYYCSVGPMAKDVLNEERLEALRKTV